MTYQKTGKREIVRIAKKIADKARVFELKYVMAMANIYHMNPDHPIFGDCDPKFVEELKSIVKKYEIDQKGKIIVPPGPTISKAGSGLIATVR